LAITGKNGIMNTKLIKEIKKRMLQQIIVNEVETVFDDD